MVGVRGQGGSLGPRSSEGWGSKWGVKGVETRAMGWEWMVRGLGQGCKVRGG